MVQFIVSEKGQGKTKRLIELANSTAKTTDGHLVFIDDDRKHMYDLNHDVRLVETNSFPLSNYRELIGFVCGILSQDGDIKDIFIDGVNKIVKKLDDEDLLKLCDKLNILSKENEVNFIIGLNYKAAQLPEQIKNLVIE